MGQAKIQRFSRYGFLLVAVMFVLAKSQSKVTVTVTVVLDKRESSKCKFGLMKSLQRGIADGIKEGLLMVG
jgi:hypothetical protein